MFGFEINEMLIYGGAILVGLVVVLLLVRMLGSRKKLPVDPEEDQREDLKRYPVLPAKKEGPQIFVQGVDARLRLVVVAPVGKQQKPIRLDEVPELLNDFMRGLSGFLQSDKPRVTVWPPQLSVAGFAPSFFRLVPPPDPPGSKSHWIRVAGPIKVAGVPYLLGLAFFSEEVTKIGQIQLETMEWNRHLEIER